MIKVCTNSYVFKFVGGESCIVRLCHYCRKNKSGPMICVYGNGPSHADDTIFVCPACTERGFRETEAAWRTIEHGRRPMTKKLRKKARR